MSEQLLDLENCLAEGPQSALERRLIEAFLLEKGFTQEAFKELPPAQAQDLMKQACQYASARLAEIEARNKFRRSIESPY